ncbi:MAG: hypothetical protein JWM10_3225 [Myxococcaceae bacterium]|nr:hypothetical protein [Myxococcaceae bacterium]
MANQFTEASHSSYGRNVVRSIVGIPVGILLFLGSFAVIWFTEGRTDWSKLAARTEVASADRGGGLDGRTVSVTGPLTSTEPLGDPDFVQPGPYLSLKREVEQFAWVEHTAARSQGRTGGSSTTQTTYTYRPEWTASPRPSSEFRVPAEHENAPMPVSSQRFVVPHAAVGAWNLDLTYVEFESGVVLPPTALQRTGRGAGFVPTGEFLFSGTGTPDVPHVGDLRVRFTALRNGTVATVFGQAASSTVAPITVDGSPWMRVISGDRAQAVQTLAAEYTATGWLGRVVAFLMMWIGMLLFLGPVSTFLNVLPFLGSASRFVVALVTFPLALVLTVVAVAVAMLAHSVVALVVSVVVLIGLVVAVTRRTPARP